MLNKEPIKETKMKTIVNKELISKIDKLTKSLVAVALELEEHLEDLNTLSINNALSLKPNKDWEITGWSELNSGGIVHAVRRLSDGTEFKVGDTINFNPIANVPPIAKISRFVVATDNRMLVYSKDSKWMNAIGNIELVKPLFLTEDGVSIYEGDSFYYCNPEIDKPFATKVTSVKPTDYAASGAPYNGPKAYMKRFSTEAAAKAWIKANKPKEILFTTEDGKAISAGDPYFTVITANWKNAELWKINTIDRATGAPTDFVFKEQYPDIIPFSTKEAAERYILENKPCLSYADIRNLPSYGTAISVDTTTKSLKHILNLVKSKIKF